MKQITLNSVIMAAIMILLPRITEVGASSEIAGGENGNEEAICGISLNWIIKGGGFPFF